MCYDSQSSMRTFLFITVVIVFLWIRNYPLDRLIFLVWFSVMLMQLAEYWMWKDQECGKTNRYATLFAKLTLYIQPIIAVLVLKFFTTSSLPDRFINTTVGVVGIPFLILIGFLFLQKYPFEICSKPGKHRHLIWDFEKINKNTPQILSKIYWVLYWFVPLLFASCQPSSLGIIYLLMFYASFIVSYYIKKDYGKEWKSYWCHMINYVTVIPIIAGYVYMKYK